MSFGFETKEALRSFEKNVLPKARRPGKKDVLLFAAASNDGANAGRAYPANFSTIFSIHSSDALGNPSNFNPPAQLGDSFCVQGQEIFGGGPVRLSGTSFATPIAAGLAATLIEFLRQNWPYTGDETKKKNALADLQTYAGMTKVFTLMAKERNQYQILLPWLELFRTGEPTDDICRTICQNLRR